MTSETVLTDEKIHKILEPYDYGDGYFDSARAIEQAILQSPEIQALRKDAERVEFIEVHYGADIVCFDNGAWEVALGTSRYGEGRSLRSAIDDAMEQPK